MGTANKVKLKYDLTHYDGDLKIGAEGTLAERPYGELDQFASVSIGGRRHRILWDSLEAAEPGFVVVPGSRTGSVVPASSVEARREC